MALMLGIRLVSWGLAGAVVGVTHQYTKDTEDKFYKWVGDKFWRRSPDPAAACHNSGDSDSIPSTGDQLQPLVHNIVDGNLTLETSPEERDLAHSVKPVSVDGARELQPTRPNAVNLCGESPDPAGATDTLLPSRPPATGVWAAVKAWIAGKLNWGVPKPDPPPATGVWATVKAWFAGKPNWGAPEPDPDPDPDGRRVPGPGGRMLDPRIWHKICRIQGKLLWLAVDQLFISLSKRNNVYLQVYRIFKCELSQW